MTRTRPTARAMGRTVALTAAALCLMLTLMAMSAFPHSQRVPDFLLAGGMLGLALADDDRRRRAPTVWLAASLLLIGALDLRGWPVLGMWACAAGGWFLCRPSRRRATPSH